MEEFIKMIGAVACVTGGFLLVALSIWFTVDLSWRATKNIMLVPRLVRAIRLLHAAERSESSEANTQVKE